MTPQTRSLVRKAIIIGASICLGAFIAFKFFRTGVQEIVDAQEIVESPSPSVPATEDDVVKTDTMTEPALTQQSIDRVDALKAETITEKETVATSTKQEQQKNLAAAKPEPKAPTKLKQEKLTPKAPEKKPSTAQPQELKGKKAQPATPSKTTGPTPAEKPTVVPPVKTEPVKPATPKEVAKPMVTVTNNIRKDMTGYKKFGKNWYPDEYSVTVNGVPVEEGEQIGVPAGDNSVCNIVFAYDFRPMGKSYKKGTEQVNHIVKPGTKELKVTFSWYKTPCIIVTPIMAPEANAQADGTGSVTARG